MNITLNPEIEKRITEIVRQGEFESAAALVEQAVVFFLDYEEQQMEPEEFREVKAAVAEALEQAERGEGISIEKFDQQMRAKYGIQV